MQNVSLGMQAVRVQNSGNQKIGLAQQMGQRSRQHCDWSAVEIDRRQVDSGQARSSCRSNHAAIAVLKEH